jgi:type VI secretion system ImpJ/VasE family protein
MRFEQQLHWHDGQFLQPHHFQYFQRELTSFTRRTRELSLPYAWGFINLEIDNEAVAGARVVVRQFSACLPGGLELSQPGNCALPSLDLSPALKSNPRSITVYLAAPNWSELEPNMAEDAGAANKLYSTQKQRVRDENTGGSEITLLTRMVNARLLTSLDEAQDMRAIPLARLNVEVRGADEYTVSIDQSFCPPFIAMAGAVPLLNLVSNLMVDLRRCRDKLFQTFSTGGPEGGQVSIPLLRLIAVNRAQTRMSVLMDALASSSAISPFDFYLELCSCLAELSACSPKNAVPDIKPYKHDDPFPCFSEVIADIRSFLTAEGGADYSRIEFTATDNGQYLEAKLGTEEIVKAKDLYLAVKAGLEEDRLARELEQGDTFKLTNPKNKALRARGVKLTHERFPPRFLPVLPNTVWFKLDTAESPRVWLAICEERGIAIDWAHGLFPGLEATLFATIE